MRLALLSSDQVLAASLLTGLAEAGHIVHVFDEKQSFLRDLGRESFDLVLVDGAPFGTGLQRFLRQVLMASISGVPLICINCDDNETRLADAFALGVDDFIRRGVGCREICARIDAVLRRLYPRQRQGDRQLDYRLTASIWKPGRPGVSTPRSDSPKRSSRWRCSCFKTRAGSSPAVI
jgi:DNA-binding response OmpR family regulator